MRITKRLDHKLSWLLLAASILCISNYALFCIFNTKECLSRPPSVLYQLGNDKQHQLKDRKKHVTLVLGILSKLTLYKRRQAIRNTWLQICRQDGNEAVCYFFTDVPDEKRKQETLDEERLHEDMLLMPIKGKTSLFFVCINLLYIGRYLHLSTCQSWNDPNPPPLPPQKKKINFYLKLSINILSDIIYSKLICCHSNSYFINLKNLVIDVTFDVAKRNCWHQHNFFNAICSEWIQQHTCQVLSSKY